MAGMGIGSLARFCHRVATGLHAGLDVLRVWDSESQRGSLRQRRQMQEIRERIVRGASLSEAMFHAGDCFPPLVCEMVEVGERTGRLDEVFLRLGEHYDHVRRLRRGFLLGIAWPLIELGLALVVIGVLIWALGAIGAQWNGRPMTVLGLHGTRGLVIYLTVLSAMAGLVGFGLAAIRQGWIKTDLLLRPLMPLPGIGAGLQIVALSRLTWSLAIATDSDLDAHKAVDLAVRSTQNSYYTSHLEQIHRAIRSGELLHTAFRTTGIYPDEFLDALETGEEAGQISESMHALAKVLEERTKHFFMLLAMVAGVGVFLLVGAILVFLIFQVAQLYLGPIYDTIESM